jgi:HD-GYP domain-containing protein (c-di-GMP phosphodiesterase class II)
VQSPTNLSDFPFGQPSALNSQSQESVLRMLNSLNQHLEHVLTTLASQIDAQAALLHIAQNLITATEMNADIALGCILLNQIRGSYAVRHCVETAIVALIVAKTMHKTKGEQIHIAAAALTMNVGMLRHQEQINNHGHTLSDAESSIIRRHPEESAELLRNAGVEDDEWLSYVLMHHECDDGSGYPLGKRHDEIPQNARIISLADRYCAYVSARNYRKSTLPDKALQEICQSRRHILNDELVKTFSEQVGMYPPGCYVRLENGDIGVVSKRPQAGGASIVHVLINAAGISLLPTPMAREADGPLFKIAQALHEDEAAIRFSLKQIWGNQASL